MRYVTQKRLAELHAEDRRRAEEFRAAYARNAELNRQIAARRNADNDMQHDLEREDGTAEARWLRRRGYVDAYGLPL